MNLETLSIFLLALVCLLTGLAFGWAAGLRYANRMIAEVFPETDNDENKHGH